MEFFLQPQRSSNQILLSLPDQRRTIHYDFQAPAPARMTQGSAAADEGLLEMPLAPSTSLGERAQPRRAARGTGVLIPPILYEEALQSKWGFVVH